MEKINYEKASFRDFEHMKGLDMYETAQEFWNYVDDWESRGHWNYRQECVSGCKPVVDVLSRGKLYKDVVALVFNDYLGFTQHPGSDCRRNCRHRKIRGGCRGFSRYRRAPT